MNQSQLLLSSQAFSRLWTLCSRSLLLYITSLRSWLCASACVVRDKSSRHWRYEPVMKPHVQLAKFFLQPTVHVEITVILLTVAYNHSCLLVLGLLPMCNVLKPLWLVSNYINVNWLLCWYAWVQGLRGSRCHQSNCPSVRLICLSVSLSVCLSHCLSVSLTVCVLQVKDVNQVALEITTMAWEKKGLRDELFIQLCRQTSSNSNPWVNCFLCPAVHTSKQRTSKFHYTMRLTHILIHII